MVNNSQLRTEQILSLILHPLMMTTYSVALLFAYADFSYIFGGQVTRILLPTFLLSCLIPALGIYFLRKAIHVVSFYETDSFTRLKLLFIVFISYFLLFYHFSQSPIFPWFLSFFVAPIILIIICLIINIWTKISLHMVGMGSLIGGILSVSYHVKQVNPFFWFAFLFFLAGLLATLRLQSGKDKPRQVYIGFIIGFLITYLCVWCGANFVYLYLQYLNF